MSAMIKYALDETDVKLKGVLKMVNLESEVFNLDNNPAFTKIGDRQYIILL